MALNINTNMNIAAKSAALPQQPAGIVSDAELTNAAKEILSATPGKINLKQAGFGRTTAVNTADVKLFESGYDYNTVRQVATNKTGLDINLSQNALASINSLKAQAAQLQSRNLTSVVDGKIHVNSEKADTAELKSAFLGSSSTDVEVFQSSNLDKDRKGSGGFYIPLRGDEEEVEEKGLNLVI